VYSRNGYCTSTACAYAASIPAANCDGTAVCSLAYPSGRCLKTCDQTKPGTCRGNSNDKLGDYECRAWNNLYAGSVKLAPSPVCEWGSFVPCTTFQAAKLTCAAVGPIPNTTAMACRNPDTGAPLADYDPSGACLDDTASGPK
jgi:hypothetical protein